MSDHPIIMSAPMVQALDREATNLGTGKTMTRRLAWRDNPGWLAPGEKIPAGCRIEASHSGGKDVYRPSPWQRVRPGDRLWVRETHYVESAGYRDSSGRRIIYRADTPDAPISKWTPAIHMYRFASRFTLIVTATKIERLQEISGGDCMAEGAHRFDDGWSMDDAETYGTPHAAFCWYWQRLHGRESWDTNPEVVAIASRVIKQNIDQIKEAAA